MLCYLMHQADRQRGLADTTEAQHADDSTAVLDYPLAKLAQFPLTSIEGRNRESIIPIQPLYRCRGRFLRRFIDSLSSFTGLVGGRQCDMLVCSQFRIVCNGWN